MALSDNPHRIDASDPARHRSLLTTQAIAAEAVRRGYEFGIPADGTASFWIAVGKDRFAFSVFEEYERRDVVDEEKLASARYSWQRVPSQLRDLPSGRLVIRMASGYRLQSWADRRRRSLDQKLPVMFQEVEDQVSALAEARIRDQQEHAQRRQAWQQAISPAARTVKP